MAEAIRNRGPDDDGEWFDSRGQVAFGFRRLAILDLSSEGHQPMVSADGRLVSVFNGEIYNFAELHLQLERFGHAFRGGSDTEVMLAAFEQWGIDAALSRFVGMFALAVWDTRSRELHLARDRLGKKPLYYAWQNGTFVFGSQLKALRAHPSFKAPIDRDALASYVRLSYVPGPRSIYAGVFKLSPGTVVTIRPADLGTLPRPRAYWDPAAVTSEARRHPFDGTTAEAVDTLRTLLADAVRLRMVADVPIGAFLSGGIDSSLIVALMQEQSERPVRTFSIGFHEREFNEATFAKAVANHLGTHHTEMCVTPEDALSVVPSLPEIYDEPFADPSQVPSYIVSRLARGTVTVALSGDGGDELFGGYDRHSLGPKLWSCMRWVPAILRRQVATTLGSISQRYWDRVFRPVNGIAVPGLPFRLSGARVQKLAGLLEASTLDQFYDLLVSRWNDARGVVVGGHELAMHDGGPHAGDPMHRMMYLDLITYLVDDILVKVDRASMSVSLEARAPYLDHRVVQFAWTLPGDMKRRNGRTKWLLRQLLYRYVPRELLERPKMGFGVPVGSWIRGPLKPWAAELLNPQTLRQDGYFDVGLIQTAWEEHQSGARDREGELWNVLMFQAWLRSVQS